MTSAILPVAGAVGGFFIGGPVGALMGANLGMAANNMFLPGKKHNVRLPSREGPRLGDLRVQLSSYGEVIPKVYGSMRLAGNITGWQPRMKPVWFTEFGFPSVDGCTNQPNVFYDPSSVESYFPRGSSGRVNFFAQRQALSSTLDYLASRK